MQTFYEMLVAVFAVIGVVSCLWLVLGGLLRPRKPNTPICMVVRAENPAELERSTGYVLWLRQWGIADLRILVLDEYLDDEAKLTALKIMSDEPGFYVGNRADVEKLLG